MPLKPADVSGGSFFGDPVLDTSLPAANEAFWAALIGTIDGDAPSDPRAILDVGCHSGGLLDALTRRFAPARIFGIEPLAWARIAASRRLANVSAAVTLLDVSQWDQVPTGAIDLVTSHEVLYLEPDVPGFCGKCTGCLLWTAAPTWYSAVTQRIRCGTRGSPD